MELTLRKALKWILGPIACLFLFLYLASALHFFWFSIMGLPRASKFISLGIAILLAASLAIAFRKKMKLLAWTLGILMVVLLVPILLHALCLFSVCPITSLGDLRDINMLCGSGYIIGDLKYLWVPKEIINISDIQSQIEEVIETSSEGYRLLKIEKDSFDRYYLYFGSGEGKKLLIGNFIGNDFVVIDDIPFGMGRVFGRRVQMYFNLQADEWFTPNDNSDTGV